jgi:CBS domain containing-hemolysin-like protein
LKALLHLHGQGQNSVLTPQEATIMSGTIDFSQKTAQQIMTPIDKVFMLNVSSPHFPISSLSLFLLCVRVVEFV